MANPTTKQTTAKPPQLKLEREFDATPDRLWSYWTDPKKYAKWLSPQKADLVIHEFDVRVGGKVRFDMPLDNGQVNKEEGVFHVLDKPRHLVSGNADKTFVIDVTFTPLDGGKRTRLTVLIDGVPADWHSAAKEGWGTGFSKLDALLARESGSMPGTRTHGAQHKPKGVSDPARTTVTKDRYLVLERWFNAPPERVYKAWTTKDTLEKFFWPVGQGKVKEFTPKVGGRLVMGHAEQPWTATWVFKELVANQRIVIEDLWDDGSGHKAIGTMEFKPENGGTRMTVRHGPFPTTGPYKPEDAAGGSAMVSDRLAEVVEVPGQDEGFRLVRHFLAPPEKVWAMWTTKEGLAKWWALSAKDMGYEFAVLKLDVRVGGQYDITMSNQEHGTLHNHGEYLEVVPNQRLVQRWDFDIFLGPGEKAYPISVVVELEKTEPWGPGSVGTKMTFTQGPMAKPEYTEGSRQGVISNLAKLEAALAPKGA